MNAQRISLLSPVISPRSKERGPVEASAIEAVVRSCLQEAAEAAEVQGWSEGDRVVNETAAVINAASPLSRTGLYNLDPSRKGFGYGVDGAMTRYVRVPERCLHAVPPGLPLEQAALTEPCCVAYNAVVNNARVRPGDRVLVLGPGPIGVLCAAIARLMGAEVALVGLERDRARLEMGRAYGCEAIVGDGRASVTDLASTA